MTKKEVAVSSGQILKVTPPPTPATLLCYHRHQPSRQEPSRGVDTRRQEGVFGGPLGTWLLKVKVISGYFI